MEEVKKQGAVAMGGACYASRWFTFDENYNSSKKRIASLFDEGIFFHFYFLFLSLQNFFSRNI